MSRWCGKSYGQAQTHCGVTLSVVYWKAPMSQFTPLVWETIKTGLNRAFIVLALEIPTYLKDSEHVLNLPCIPKGLVMKCTYILIFSEYIG